MGKMEISENHATLEKYETPEMEIVLFDEGDIQTTGAYGDGIYNSTHVLGSTGS